MMKIAVFLPELWARMRDLSDVPSGYSLAHRLPKPCHAQAVRRGLAPWDVGQFRRQGLAGSG